MQDDLCLLCQTPLGSGRMYCSNTCSQRARLISKELTYSLNPKKCKQCLAPLPYKKHWTKSYCSRSCAATLNNHLVPKRRSFKPEKEKQSEVQMRLFRSGNITTRRTLRQLLIKTVGPQCQVCKLEPFWQGSKLVMVVDHIDGQPKNNQPSNLRLLCPNCNSQTPTFCGRNVKKGRRFAGGDGIEPS